MPSMIRKQQRSWFGLNRESEEERVEDECIWNVKSLHILKDNKVQVPTYNANYIKFGGLLLSKVDRTKDSVFNRK